MQDEIELKKIGLAYYRNKFWFVLSGVLCFTAVYFYMKDIQSIYKTSTRVFVEEKDNSKLSSELEAFSDLGYGDGSSSTIENEILYIKSREIIKRLVKSRNLQIEYSYKGLFKDKIFINDSPVSFELLSEESSNMTIDTLLRINKISNYEFEFLDDENKVLSKHLFGEHMKFRNIGDFMILPNEVVSNNESVSLINIISLERAVNNYSSKINVSRVGSSSMIDISMEGVNKSKAESILDNLVLIYNEFTQNDKSIIAEKTKKFIDDRLNMIEKDLSGFDIESQNFKSKNKLINMGAENNIYLQNSNQIQGEIFRVNNSLNIINNTISRIDSDDSDFKVIPSNIGVDDQVIVPVINMYNNLLLKRNKYLDNSSITNVVIVNIDKQLSSHKENIYRSLHNLKGSLSISLVQLKQEYDKIIDKIISVPMKERQSKDIMRQLKIKEDLYVYLLKKGEENAISLAITAPNSKVVDIAYSSLGPIFPRRKMIYLGGFAFGLVIVFGFVTLKFVLNNNIQSKEDLKEISDIPFLGEIPKSKEGILKTEYSLLAEAYRMIKINLGFFINTKSNDCKTIFVTSTMSNEGKTFNSINLAKTLSEESKKVVLLNLDLRASVFENYLDLKHEIGVTDYVKNENINIEDIKQNISSFPYLDIINIGAHPPNPINVLSSDRIKQMFYELKKTYDYIVVDTPPVHLVADTMMVSEYADMFIYVLRANHSRRELLHVPNKLYKENRLTNMAILLNDIELDMNYGYNYGYSYSKKSKFKNIISTVKKKLNRVAV